MSVKRDPESRENKSSRISTKEGFKEMNSGAVLVTGATGFVGSALVANLLAHDKRVIAISRNDPEGDRTRAAVRDAAAGFSRQLTPDQWERLDVLNADLGSLSDTLDVSRISGVSGVWHCAAEMSYSNRKLLESYRMNAAATGELYRIVNQHCPACRRFYYVSTAYTAGVRGGVAKEELHFDADCVNTYQIIKWAVEHMLYNCHRSSQVPVTVFRPSVVVGHPKTGWAHRSSFGMYMFADAINAAAEAGTPSVTFDLDPGSTPDLVTIDTVVELALALTQRIEPGDDFEVYHGVGGCRISVADILTVIGDSVGIKVLFDRPVTQLDQKVNRAIEPNRVFANAVWHFDQSRLKATIGTRYYNAALDRKILRRIVDWYLWGETVPPVVQQIATAPLTASQPAD